MEPEMVKLFGLFSGAANAIVNASELKKQVGELATELASLRETLHSTEEIKATLEARLARERDELNLARDQLDTLRASDSHKSNRISDLEYANRDLSEQLQRTAADRDKWITRSNDNEFQLLQTQDHLTSAEKTLADIRAAMGWKEPEPEAPAVDIPASPPAPEPIVNPPQEWHGPPEVAEAPHPEQHDDPSSPSQDEYNASIS
jgi:chromosome segregation ATPase